MNFNLMKFGSETWWKKYPLFGYGGVVYHIVHMAAEHEITSRKAVELIDHAIKVRYCGSKEETPPAPWAEYLRHGYDEDKPSENT